MLYIIYALYVKVSVELLIIVCFVAYSAPGWYGPIGARYGGSAMRNLYALLDEVARLRRAGKYEEMTAATTTLLRLLYGIEHRLDYENLMSMVQQAEALEGAARLKMLEEAEQLAMGFVETTEEVGDSLAAGYLCMVLGAHILPKLNRAADGVQLLRSVLANALTFTSRVVGEDRFRYDNLLMNVYVHLLDLGVRTNTASPHELSGWLQVLRANPVFAAKTAANPTLFMGELAPAGMHLELRCS